MPPPQNKARPPFPLPGAASAHVWKFNWPALPGNFDADAFSLLSGAEREKRERYKMPDDRARFTAARALLRHLGGLYLQCPAQSLTIGENPHGKPFFSGAGDRLSFNVSHSGSWIFIAFAGGAPIGIDVQQMTERTNREKIARAVYHPEEIAALEDMQNPEEKRALFYRLWARKEAVIKAAGDGLHGAMETFSALPDAVRYGPEAVYELHDLRADETHSAALAVCGRGYTVLEKEWLDALWLGGQL